jgi:hypothetical protein
MPVVAGREERELDTAGPADRWGADRGRPASDRPWDHAIARARRMWAEDGPFLVLLAATFVFCLFLLRPGHDWGDDFSLYINQARALVKGEVQEVYRQNQFTVDNSAWQSFSPYTYGWGFPLLLAPLYALFGLSFTAFKLLEVVLYLGFLAGFYALIRNRIDRLTAVLIVAALALDNLYTAWTNTVLTEFPFLCFSVLGLLAIESVHRSDRLARRPPGVGLLAALLGTGALIGFTTNIRNEGIVLLGALAARQLVVVYEHRRDWSGTWPARLALLALPWIGALVVGGGIRAVLPTDAGRALALSGGLGGHNFETNDGFYRQTMAELLAVKDKLHGTVLLGLIVFVLVLALGGMLLGGRRDLSLSVFTLGLSTIYLVLPYREGRYLLGVLPFLLYFASQGLRGADVRDWPIQARHVLLLALVARHGLGMANASDYWRTYPRAIDGPSSATSQEMFTAVNTFTGPDDTVVFFRPRALNLFTDRTAITAGSSLQVLLERGDWYAMAKASEYAQCALTDEEAAATGHLTKVWENEAWVLWHVQRLDGAPLPAVATDVSTCRL